MALRDYASPPDRPQVLLSVLAAALIGSALAFADAPLLWASIALSTLVALPLIRSNARTWLGYLVLVVALDGVVKLLFWPNVWPQLITPVVMGCVYARTLFTRGELSWLERAGIPLVGLSLLTLLSLLSMVVQNQANPLMGAVGIYTWVAFAPLAWVGATLISDRIHLERAIRCVLLLAIPIAGAAAIEYIRGAGWYASLGPGFAQATLGVAGFSGGGVYRVNGTFSSPAHLSGFMIPVTFLSVVAMAAGDSRTTRLAGGVGLLASIVTLFANNQRSWVVIVLVGMPLLFLMTKSIVRAGRWLHLGATALGGLLLGAVIAGPALMDRILTIAIDPIQIIFGTTLGRFGFEKLASTIDTGTLLGHGPGTATIGARYFGPIWDLTENYFANAYYELGPLGLMAILVVVSSVPLIVLRAWLAERDPFVRALLAATLVYQASIIVLSISYSPLAYPPGAMFFWIGGGIAAARLAAGEKPTVPRGRAPVEPSFSHVRQSRAQGIRTESRFEPRILAARFRSVGDELLNDGVAGCDGHTPNPVATDFAHEYGQALTRGRVDPASRYMNRRIRATLSYRHRPPKAQRS